VSSATDTPGTPGSSAAHPLRVAVVGSGPAGFYAIEALTRLCPHTEISLIERLPVPFGLVRYGVAPDHPKLKQTAVVFDKLAQSGPVRFFGHVTVGQDVSVDELQATHHAVIFACGAESDRALGIPGESLPGSHTATEFVGWYNGHPDYRDHHFDLSQEVAVVIGQGNVAADVARILLKPVDALRQTDIAAHALDALSSSRVREVHVIGRRGPAQAKFTHKELRELGELPGCATRLDADPLALGAACEAELADKHNDSALRNVDIFRSWAARVPEDHGRSLHWHFLASPAALLGSDRVEGLRLTRNRLEGTAGAQVAVATDQQFDLPCGLVFRSIGYRGCALPGVPFDNGRGTFANTGGRITGSPGLYAAGWIKRGPSGIIGTNRADALATVEALMADLHTLSTSPKPGAEGLQTLLASRGVRNTNYQDWLRIDASERQQGELLGKPREKLTRVADMLAALD
jgi:ferredoxin/flavodoxin---NADP+ reductase